MYLIDTNVISEIRKKTKANRGVRKFFADANKNQLKLFISVIALGELRRGVELIRHRGDHLQAKMLESWLESIVNDYTNNILDFTETEAQIWGRLRVPNHENSIDKQIAAIALVNDLILVTRNTSDFANTGVKVLNPFEI